MGKYYSTEKERQIYKIKRIARTNLLFKLMKFVSALLIVLLLCLPLIKVDALFVEEKISVLDILLSKGDAETFKGYTASYFAAELFGIAVEDYTNFFNALTLPITTGTFAVKTMIFNGLVGISIMALVMYAVASIFGVIKAIFKACVGGALTLATTEKFNKAFAIEYDKYYFDKEAGESALSSKSQKKRFVKYLILYILLVALTFIFPYCMYTSLIKDEAVIISKFIPILFVALYACMFFGLIATHLYGEKYSGTLLGCEHIKNKNI